MKLILQKLGLQKEEIKIYQACLGSPPQTLTELSRKTAIRRTTIYPHLNRLLEMGLVSFVQNKKRKLIKASSFASLESFIDQEEQKFESKKVALKSLEKIIKDNIKHSSNQEGVEIIEGRKGLIQLMKLIIKENKDVYWFGSFEKIIEIVGEKLFFKHMTWKRMGQKTTAYSISDNSLKTNKKFSEIIGDFRKMKTIQNIDGSGLLVIFGDKVALGSLKKNRVKIFLVETKIVAETMRFLFLEFWNRI